MDDNTVIGTMIGLVVATVGFIAIIYYRQGRLEEGIVDLRQNIERLDNEVREMRREFREELRESLQGMREDLRAEIRRESETTRAEIKSEIR